MTIDFRPDPRRATDYETVFILRPDIDAETSEKVISRAVAAIESSNGKLTRVESWGKRRLAFPVGKQRKGFYVYLRYLGMKGTVYELERNLRMLDTVLRHLTVVIAKNVDMTAVVIDPEEVKVRRIEITAEEDDREDSFEASLGLADNHDRRDRDRDREAQAVEAEAAPVEAAEAEAKPAAEA
ncbi:MAG: 30S ribosomal protein S6 [Myxococcales bacterium]|nr:30S ribosomal protein S6 [Myxococcales bacterium]